MPSADGPTATSRRTRDARDHVVLGLAISFKLRNDWGSLRWSRGEWPGVGGDRMSEADHSQHEEPEVHLESGAEPEVHLESGAEPESGEATSGESEP